MQTRTNERTRTAPRGAPRAEPKAEGRKLACGPEAPAPDPKPVKPDPHHAQTAMLRAMRGRRVTLRLLDGETLTGVLVTNDVYCLAIRSDDAPPGADGSPALPALVFKHACAVVDWARDGDG